MKQNKKSAAVGEIQIRALVAEGYEDTGGLINAFTCVARWARERRPDPYGVKVAVFYTKLHNRLLRPLLADDQPQAPPELRAALRAIDQHIGTYITRARLSPAA
jgi:hypothetical protein